MQTTGGRVGARRARAAACVAGAFALATLASAAATATTATASTFGADLNQPPNNTITCDQGWPNDILGGFLPPFGSSSCLWAGSGVSQTLYAPASGTVSAIHVRVGPTTGPMQVVVLRTLYKNTFTPGKPELACCVIEAYGPHFTPTPNSVTTVSTSLAMVEEPTPAETDTTTIAAGDLLALEVLAPGVPIPAYTATGGGPGEAPDFAWFPAPSQAGIGAPSTNVVSFNGDFGGYQLLLSADMGAPGPTPQPLPSVLPTLAFPKLTLPVRRGRISLPLRCTGANCFGRLLLQSAAPRGAKIAQAAKKRKHRKSKAKRRVITYGSAAVKVPAGAKKTVSVKLNARGRKATRRHKRLKVWANFTFGSIKLSKRITLRR
jgi:hypothetical protein